jgi:hypothetical protein
MIESGSPPARPNRWHADHCPSRIGLIPTLLAGVAVERGADQALPGAIT